MRSGGRQELRVKHCHTANYYLTLNSSPRYTAVWVRFPIRTPRVLHLHSLTTRPLTKLMRSLPSLKTVCRVLEKNHPNEDGQLSEGAGTARGHWIVPVANDLKSTHHEPTNEARQRVLEGCDR